jgi:hypothetical protein
MAWLRAYLLAEEYQSGDAHPGVCAVEVWDGLGQLQRVRLEGGDDRENDAEGRRGVEQSVEQLLTGPARKGEGIRGGQTSEGRQIRKQEEKKPK